MTDRNTFLWTFGIAATAAFAFALDRLVVSTALPTIQADLGTGTNAAEWVVSSYTLTFAMLLLGGASLGDRFGRRRIFRVGIALYTGGSAAAALAPDALVLVLARSLQGAGGALFLPLALAMVNAVAPAARRGAVLGVWGAVGGAGAALGPLVGGVLTDLAGWRAVFWVNVPVGVATLVAARRLPEHTGGLLRIDVRGLLLSSTAVLVLVWTLLRAADTGWSDPLETTGLLVGTALLAAFVRWETRPGEPMLAPALFRERAFGVAVGAALAMYAALFGGLYFIAQFLQIALVTSPLQTGVRLLPMAIMPMLVSPVGGVLADRFGTRVVLVAGLLCEVTGLWWLAAVAGPDVGYAYLVPGLVFVGVGSGLFFAPVMSAAIAAVPARLNRQAAGAFCAVREFAAVLGVAVLGLMFGRDGDANPATRLLDGFGSAMTLAGGLAAAGALLVLCAHARRPDRTAGATACAARGAG